MSSRARVVLAAAAVVVVVAAAIGGVAWYALGEQRRTARIIAGMLSERTGLPIAVERASADSARVRLWGVEVPSGPSRPFVVRVKQMEIAGGVLPFIAPAGRRISVVATSTSIVLVGGGGAAPDAHALDAARGALRALLDWPGALTLEVDGGELRGGDGPSRFALDADKTGAVVTMNLTLASPDGPPALRLAARGSAADAAGVVVVLDVAGEPRRLGGLWPARVPAPATLALRADLALAPGAPLSGRGRATVTFGDQPAVLDFDARYDAAAGDVEIARYALDWGPAVHLEGEAALRRGAELTAVARGTLDGSPLGGRTMYMVATGGFDGEATVERADSARLARRLGVPVPPLAPVARTARARFSGTLREGTVALALDGVAGGLSIAPAPGLAVDASLATAVDLVLVGGGVQLRRIDRARLTLAREGRTLGVVTATAGAGTGVPIAIDAQLDDVGAFASVLPLKPTLAGTASFRGEIARLDAPDLAGTLEALLSRVVVDVGGPMTLTDVRAHVPVVWGRPADGRPGSLFVDRAAAWGLALQRAISDARVTDGRLLLPDLKYVHYRGHGGGWLDAGVDEGTPPLRLRLEGERVDLAEVVRESGSTAARVTGTVRYVATAQYTERDGLVAAVRLDSEPGGGEVSIEAIQRLLESATVQAETTGVLRQTLENLKTFRYETLEGDVRVRGGVARADLSLRGRKRLGIFPGPVEAINLKNVPLALLARAFGGERTP